MRQLWLVVVGVCGAVSASLLARTVSLPTTRLVSAPELAVPGRVDSSVPMLWTRLDGQLTLVAFASWGGAPMRMAGPNLEGLQVTGDIVLDPHPGNGVWFESVIADHTDTTWYAYYQAFSNEGIYVSFAPRLDDPRAWSAPRKLLNGGGWYPQVAGLEPGSGTDSRMGSRGRFLLTGRSTRFIEFSGR